MEENRSENSHLSFSAIFEYCLLALIFLTPIIFYPSILTPLYAIKIVFVVAAIVVFIGTFLAFVLSGGEIQYPRSKLLIPLLAFPLLAIISSLFSGAATKSVVGEVFELGTSGSFLILTLLVFLSMFAVRENARTATKAIWAFMLSLGVILLHLLLRVFAGLLPTAIAARIPNFLTGGPTDTIVLLGGGVIVALALLGRLPLGRKTYVAACLLLGLAMAFIGAVGFMPVIVAVGVFALIYFVYIFSWSTGSSPLSALKHNKAVFPSLFVLVLSVIFTLSHTALSESLSAVLKINVVEVRPNFAVTAKLVGEAWKANPVLGVGPNMFKELWDLQKPLDINMTQFWSTNFNFGSGFMPTVAATTGLLGLAALIGFLSLFVRAGFKSVFSPIGDSDWRFISLTVFLLSLFFWAMSFFYAPSLAVMSIMFIFTGIALAALVPQGVVSSVKINIFSNPKANFAAVFVIMVLLISAIAGGYFVAERVVAASVFQRGYNLLVSGESSKAKDTLVSALRLSENDFYWRVFSEASLVQVDLILSSISSPENMSESQRAAIQTSVAEALEGAKKAIAWNSKNYENWFALGRIYEVLAQNGIEGAAQNAQAAFLEAQNLAPLNPVIPLSLGRLAALDNDLVLAKENVNKAIELKRNYTDAYFVLAQIEAASNNIPEAIKSVEAATLTDPNNAALYFQLGLLKYNYNEYTGAANAFKKAIELVPDYANAQYFLGLSYDKLGRRSEAIAMFEALLESNAESGEVAFILSNLKAGKQPFANAEPPIDDKPEKRTEPPVEED